MKRGIWNAFALAALLALPLRAEVKCSGTPCIDATGVAIQSSLTANTVPKATGVNTLGNSTITDDGTTVTVNTATTMKAAVTDGVTQFLGVTGTIGATTGANAKGVNFTITGAGSQSFEQRAIVATLAAGYTGSSRSQGGYFINTSAGTAATDYAVTTTNGVFGLANGSPTVGVGVAGLANSGTMTRAYGGLFGVNSGTISTGIGVAGFAPTGTVKVGGYFSLLSTAPTYVDGALQADNAAVAVPIFIAKDNSAALPTTAATATFSVLDGAQPQSGNAVLTNATMAAETQGQLRDAVHSYTWTNAQVTALPTTAGDITVATLPAKTQLLDALVVITGAAAGPATVTVSCGDANGGTPFINLVAVADAKAAANTVYGDALAERGTSIDTEFYYLPSYTATTLVTCHFISTGANLSTVTGSTGRVILITRLLP